MFLVLGSMLVESKLLDQDHGHKDAVNEPTKSLVVRFSFESHLHSDNTSQNSKVSQMCIDVKLSCFRYVGRGADVHRMRSCFFGTC